MEVIKEPIGDRSLWRYSLECRMRVDCACGSIKAWVRNPPLANVSIVSRQRLDQVLDRIVRIGALVDAADRSGHLGYMRSHIDELPTTHVPTSNILENKDVSVSLKLGTWAETSFVGAQAIRSDTIGCAAQENGILFRGVRIVRSVDACKKLDSITHPDPNLGLRVVGSDVVGPRIGLRFVVQLGSGLSIEQYYLENTRPNRGKTSGSKVPV